MTNPGLPPHADPADPAGGLMLDDIPPPDMDADGDETWTLDEMPHAGPSTGTEPDDGPLIP